MKADTDTRFDNLTAEPRDLRTTLSNVVDRGCPRRRTGARAVPHAPPRPRRRRGAGGQEPAPVLRADAYSPTGRPGSRAVMFRFGTWPTGITSTSLRSATSTTETVFEWALAT